MFEIKINNRKIDYISSTNFPFLLSIEEVFDQINKRGGESTYTVQHPNTPNNRSIFKINQYHSSTFNFYSTEKFEYIVTKNGTDISRGFATIQKITRDFIEIVYIGNSVNWINLIGKKKLRDIQSFADYPFNGMNEILANIDAYIANPTTHFDFYDVIFPLVAYGNYFLPFWSNATLNKYIDTTDYSALLADPTGFPSWRSNINGVDVNGPQIQGTNGQVPHLSFEDIPPAFSFVNIFRKIFEDIGWSVGGRFLEKEETKKLVLPATGLKDIIYNWGSLGYYEIEQTGVDANLTPTDAQNFTTISDPLAIFPLLTEYTIAYLAVTQPIAIQSTINVDDRGWLGTNPQVYGDIFIPEDGEYQIDWLIEGDLYAQLIGFPANYTVFPIVGLFPVETLDQLDLIENSTQTQVTPNITYVLNPYASKVLVKTDAITDSWNTIYWTPGAPQVVTYSESQSFKCNLKKGQILRFLMIYKDTPFPITLNPFAKITNFSLKVENLTGDVDFKIAKNLPDMQQIDYVKSAISMFNLKYTSDNDNKIIYFDEHEDFFLPAIVNLDLTELTDTKNISTYPNEVAKKYSFRYNNDANDFLINQNLDFNSYVETPIHLSTIDEQEITCNYSATQIQQFQLVRNLNKAGADFVFNELSRPAFTSVRTLDLPIIADATHYNCPQFGEGYESWVYSYVPRIMRIADVLDLDQFKIPVRITPDALFFRQEFLTLNNDSLDWETLYMNQYYNWILNLQLGDQNEVLIYINDYIYSKIKNNMLIKISGVLYYLKKLENYNPAKEGLTNFILIKKV
jgi:hypothetical protein